VQVERDMNWGGYKNIKTGNNVFKKNVLFGHFLFSKTMEPE
jgi:hypothetical protein